MRARTLKRGFTLIELLVVIAIIAILAAILFPVFARLKEKGRRTNCISNLKQIGIALITYTDDYDGRLPDSPAINFQKTPPPDPIALPVRMEVYVKNAGIWVCPSDIDNYVAWYGTSYQWRGRGATPGSTGNGSVPIVSNQPLSSFANPSDLGILRDGRPWHHSVSGSGPAFWNRPDSISNVLFLDGHVKGIIGTAYTAGIL